MPGALHLDPAEARRIRADIVGRKHVCPGQGKAREVSERTLYLDLLLGRHEDEARAALGRIAFHRAGPEKKDESDV